MAHRKRASTGFWNDVDDAALPGPIANFKGSFVTDHLTDLTQYHVSSLPKTRREAWVAGFKEGWTDMGIWKSAFIEFVATALLCYLSGLIGTTISNFGSSATAAYASISNIFLLTLFIMAAGPGSGGHVNQTITFATMLTGLTGFSRGILYLGSQTLGAGLAGGLLQGGFGHDRSIRYHGGGCFRDAGSVSSGQALLLETISSFAFIFLAFGVGLDPRQQKLFGMFMGPLAVGCSVGLTSFASGGLAPGYTGASMHPGRCFAFAVARQDFAGPIGGAVLHAIVFRIAPPYHSGRVAGSE